jgi:ornithine--oxo-acid transaminase
MALGITVCPLLVMVAVAIGPPVFRFLNDLDSKFLLSEHGSTFGGNPLACAVARAALRVLVEKGMVENAAEMGAYFLDGLGRIDNPSIKSVRGRGLMLAVEFHPEAGSARQYCLALKDRGLLCKDTHTIRLAPPLVITREEVNWALDQLAAVLG